MKKLYARLFSRCFAFIMIFAGLMVSRSSAQTNNYYGTSGALSGSVWSTNPTGPYTSPLNTTGGAIINFQNAATPTGGSISVSGINSTANVTLGAISGTISNTLSIVPISVATGTVLDFGTQNFTGSGPAGYVKNGGGTLAMAGGTYGGGFVLNAGTMIIRGVNAMGGNTTNALVLNGGILAANNTRDLTGKYPLGITIGGNIQFGEIAANNPLALNNASLTFTNSIALGGATRTLTLGNSGTYSFGGAMSGSPGVGVIYTANANGIAGTFVIPATAISTYTGPTSIGPGTLSIGSITNGGTAGPLGAATAAAGNLNFLNNGTLSYTGTSASTDRDYTLASGSATLIVSNAATVLTLTGNSNAAAVSFQKSGAGTLLLTGSQFFTGFTDIAAGTLRLGASERLDNLNRLVVDAGATFDMNGFNESISTLLGTGGTITTSTAGNCTLTLGAGTATYQGNIQNGAGTLNLVKSGSGIQTLSATTTYTGATSITGGTLQLSASPTLAAGNAVFVAGGGVLQISGNQTLSSLSLAAGATLTVDAGVTLTITGTLTVNTGATVNGGGTVAYGPTGVLIYNGTSIFTSTYEWPTSAQALSVTINAGATVLLQSAKSVTSGNFLTVNGTLNASTYSIAGSGAVAINGTFITANLNGYLGTGAAFTGTSPALGASSIIEYDAPSGTQVITTSPSYKNLMLSVGGTKTAASALSIANNLTISGTAFFDADNATIGGAGTNVIMLNTASYRQAGTGTQPAATGTYTLAPTTKIIFANNAATQQDIRLSPLYANIDITGSNVGLSGNTSSLTLQAATTFTVKSTGTFNVKNIYGWRGAVNTAISNVNSPVVGLEAGSTVKYDNTGNQIVSLGNYSNIIFTGSGIRTAEGNMIIYGNLSRPVAAATFAHNNFAVTFDNFDNVSHTYSSVAPGIEFYDVFSLNTVAPLVINGDMGINHQLTFGNNSQTTFGTGNISLRSSATTTAAITQMDPANLPVINYTGTGRFRIERFVGQNRKWQLLSIPTMEAGHTIRSEWMEGSISANDNLVPGYGTQVTDERPNAVALGFDAKSSSGPSVKMHDPIMNAYTRISSPSDPIATDAGYYAFVRGDRLSLNSPSTTNNSTRLRTTGKIKNGTITVSDGSATGTRFQVIGNPYASAVNLKTLTYLNTTGNGKGNVYVWDPTVGGAYGVGKFVLLSYDGFNYIADNTTGGPYAGGGLYNNLANYIQSGQAFFVQSNGSAGSVTFTEAAKDQSVGTSTVNFNANESGRLRTSLYTMNDGVNPIGADGAMVLFGDNMNSALDGDDAFKMLNTTDNLSFKTGGQLIGIERRHTITGDDTLQLNISAMRVLKYRFTIECGNLDASGRKGFLIDRVSATQTPIDLSAITTVDFAVTSDPLTSSADRFLIVFKQTAAPAEVKTNEGVFVKVAPNPVTDKTIHLQISNQKPGKYSVQLLNGAGQNVYSTTISVSGIFQNTTLAVPKDIAAGTYHLVMKTSGEKEITMPVFIQ